MKGRCAIINPDGEIELYVDSGSFNIVNNQLVFTRLNKILHVREEQPSGTNGGTFTAGSYVTRVLNTVKTNTIDGASLATNIITLPAGIYKVNVKAPACSVSNHKAKLYNETTMSDLIIGYSMNASSTYGGYNLAEISGIITLTEITNLTVKHQCSVTKGTNGLGVPSTFGDVEVYTDVMIEKIG